MFSKVYNVSKESHKVEQDDNEDEDQEDKAGHEETKVCIQESKDEVVDHQNISNPQEEQEIQTEPVKKNQSTRKGTLCRGLLCAVMLAVIITLTTSFSLEIIKLNDKYSKLLAKLLDIGVNTTQLQISYETLNLNHTELKERVMQQKKMLEGMKCPKGWTRFGCSFYFKSSVTKTWSESRNHCQENGADLVIINSKEELNFMTDYAVWDSWIGMRLTAVGKKFEWIDGSPQTREIELNWGKRLSSKTNHYKVVYINLQGKIFPSLDYVMKHWVCEKQTD